MVCEKVGSTVKAMQLRVHIRCVRLKSSAAQTDQFLTSMYLESILKAYKEPSVWYFNVIQPSVLHSQTKPKPRYFRQYRNPGQNASGKNGTYGDPRFL